jgi:hypothetical protein
MRLRALTLVLVSLAVGRPALVVGADDPAAALTEKAKACIISNAAQTERLDPSLSDAAQFLLSYACAKEVEAREKYERNVALLASLQRDDAYEDQDSDQLPVAVRRQLEQQRSQQHAAYAKAHVDPQTGEIVMPTDAPPSAAVVEVNFSPLEAPTDLRAFSAHAVIEARAARLKSESAKQP